MILHFSAFITHLEQIFIIRYISGTVFNFSPYLLLYNRYQGCYKVVQPWNNLGTTYTATWVQGYYKVVTRLLQPCNKVETIALPQLFQGCNNMLSSLELGCNNHLISVGDQQSYSKIFNGTQWNLHQWTPPLPDIYCIMDNS